MLLAAIVSLCTVKVQQQQQQQQFDANKKIDEVDSEKKRKTNA